MTAVPKIQHWLALQRSLPLEFSCLKLTTGSWAHLLLRHLFPAENKNINWAIKKENMILDPSSKDFSGISNLWKRLFSVHTHTCWAMWPVTPSKWLYLSLFNEFNCVLQRHSASDRVAELVSHFGVHWSLPFRHLRIGHVHLNPCRQMSEPNLGHSCSKVRHSQAESISFLRCVSGFSSFSFHSERKWQWLLGCCWIKQMCARLGTPDWVSESKCHLWITD